MKYKVGSAQLGISNNHDVDYLVLCDGDDSRYSRRWEDGEDIVYRSQANIDKQMNFGFPLTMSSARYYIINYQLDKDIIGQDFPLEYHILDRRDDYINLLRLIANNGWLNFRKIPRLNNGHLCKCIYHIAYITFILLNNSTTLTVEQKEIVQKIHDRQMPQDYLDELETIIRGLK